ncbi:peptidase C15, pyroglutamyl peptidase I-like protein [Lophiostoma macrostomum CBS 122681]|uniref:Peptidase C15, pyroglutamyl peptidase I-like protein n=1 Tax=Lophiostoma macrostomum CBS 122681 TaxID=1314788 RepID=A0A6A6SR25_9PLEO|nr:peptidase C15, pyroglutamyl peptidase I-like protein [Lophiostoma macrostomum CBS 122681]
MPRTSTYAARQPPAEKSEDPVTVLVTGFGPFLAKYPRNSSWDIASTLPALLPATKDNPTPIHIHVYHEPIRVAYDTVTSLVPTLLPPNNPMYPSPDIILHIGLAAGREFFTLEKGAHGRGYDKIPDVDGGRFTDKAAEKLFPRSEFPPVLKTSFDVDDVLVRWRANLDPNITAQTSSLERRVSDGRPDVRLSPDAGNFMCGFIYWNSLAHYFSIKEDERPVVFLHVPDLSYSQEALDQGREVAVALIKALVESKRRVGVVDGVERVVRKESIDAMVADDRAGTDVNFA